MNELITNQEIQVYRNPLEFITWFETYLEKIEEKVKIDRRYREEATLRTGIYKVVYEEIFPLYRFLQVFSSEWYDLRFRNVIGNQNCDVEVVGSDNLPFYFIEITIADMDRSENLRTQYALKNRSVPMIGKVTSTGTKHTGRNIEVDDSASSHDETNEAKKTAISKAIRQKASKNYPDNTILLVYFDDCIAYSREEDLDDMIAFIETIKDNWESNFSSLYIIGSSGRYVWLKLNHGLGSSLDNIPKMDAPVNSAIRQQKSSRIIQYTRITNKEEL